MLSAARINKIIPVITLTMALCGVMCSCSVTKRIPEGEYLLRKNKIEVDREISRKLRVEEEEVERFVRQTPTKRFLGTNLYLHLHNQADPGKTGWWHRTFRNLGLPPTILDTTQTVQSATSMENYLKSRGFYDARASFRIDTSKKKAVVTYTLEQNDPYYVGDIRYNIRDSYIEPLILADTAFSYIRTGGILDESLFIAERKRISDNLRNSGFYFFGPSNIHYLADSTGAGNRADITVLITQSVAGYRSDGTPIPENHSVYRIRDIYVDPDVGITSSNRSPERDTVYFRGLEIISPKDRDANVRKKILRNTINLNPNSIYRADEVDRVSGDIMRLGYFRSARIRFDEVTDSTTFTRLESTVRDSVTGAAPWTWEKWMDCEINCVPRLKQSYKIELEGTSSSNYYGISATVGYLNRNLFRGVELFDASVKGGYEFIRSKGTKSSFELGGTVSMSFPRFISPVKVDRYRKSVNPRTRFELSLSSQRRPYYNRVISGANWGYSWSNRNRSTFTFRPLDINLINVSYLDQGFKESISNPYLLESYNSQLLLGFSGGYLFNSLRSTSNINTPNVVFRFNWETAGNVLRGLSSAFSDKVYSEQEFRYYKVLGIQFAQYFRLDASVSSKFIMGPKTNIAYRLYVGGGRAYGNSVSIPIDRQFYSGGSNSMRGWVARTLGPGSKRPGDDYKYPSQTGEFKLELNAELRFPVWDMLNGALFFDMGNVWNFKRSGLDEAEIFRIRRFYRQLGFNTGLGARFDIGVIVLRLDWGVKLFNPNETGGQKWINGLKLSDTVLSFGVGYPF